MLETVVNTHDLRPRDVGEFCEIDEEFLSLITGREKTDTDEFLFFDIETSGLSVGVGNMIYLAGFGSIEDGLFETRQYLISDALEEKELVKNAIEEFSRKKVIVTFNGKTFDLPVLEGRTRFYGYIFDLDFNHLDLLHVARTLLPMEKFSLKRLEVERLGLYREFDVPSQYIPELFLQYLKERDPQFSEPILKHNEYDVLSMAHLLLELNTTFSEKSDPRVIYRIGRLYENVSDYSKARGYYEQAMDYGIDYELELMVMKRLASVYKRSGHKKKAVEVLKTLLSYDDPYPYLELAKYYEKEKDYEAALSMTEHAIERFPRLKKKLVVRLRRLEAKYGRAQNS